MHFVNFTRIRVRLSNNLQTALLSQHRATLLPNIARGVVRNGLPTCSFTASAVLCSARKASVLMTYREEEATKRESLLDTGGAYPHTLARFEEEL